MAILPEVLHHGCELLPTLQTREGMVLNCGKPEIRALEKEDSFFNYTEAEITATAAHFLRPLPYSCSELDLGTRETLVRNLWAAGCGVTRSTLMEYIRRRKRLDVEQVVAMVLAFVPAEVGSKLAPLVSDMFVSSNMWRTRRDCDFGVDNSLDGARERKMTRLRHAVVDVVEAERMAGDMRLIRVLMRVRRERSALSYSQRLCFPKYLFALLPEDERDAWSESYSHGLQREVDIESGSVIKVTKTLFARMQRWLLRLDGDCSEQAVFIREVRRVEKQIHFGDLELGALENTEDPSALAFSFMAVQRRLQRTVVSDIRGWEFLKKGQEREVLQNRPDIVTSFEEELACHATDERALVAIRPPPSFKRYQSSTANLADEIDDVCTLMEDYVLLFGEGRFENLRFGTTRREGWKGRGPDDVYNLLVDVLATLRQRADGHFIIGPCHKFLARDIMAANNAWTDDAFAPGKTHGWVDWLQGRQKLRIRLES